MDDSNLQHNRETAAAQRRASTAKSRASAAGGCTATQTRTTRAVNLPMSVLNRIDDIRLDLLKALPYAWRSMLDEELFITVVLAGAAIQYESGAGDDLPLIEELRKQLSEECK